MKDKIDLCTEDAKSQVALLIKLKNDIKSTPHTFPEINPIASQNVQRALNCFHNDQYFHSFISIIGNDQKSIKDFHNLEGIIDFLFLQNENVIKMVGNVSNNEYDRKSEFRSKYNSFWEFMNNISAYLQKHGHQNELVQLTKITIAFNKNYQGNNLGQIEYIILNLISPLFNLFNSILFTSQEMQNFTIYLKEYKNIYDNVVYNNLNIANGIDFGIDKYNQVINKIKESSEKLNNLNL